MSDLVAIAYPDAETAKRARGNLAEGVKDGVIEVEDVVVLVRNHDGTFDLQQAGSGVGAAAAGGAMYGGAIGLIFLAPLLGMAIGAVAGGAAWKGVTGDPGVAENFIDGLEEQLEPGRAALVLLIRKMDLDQVLPRLQEQGRVIQTSLSTEVETQLDQVMGQAGA